MSLDANLGSLKTSSLLEPTQRSKRKLEIGMQPASEFSRLCRRNERAWKTKKQETHSISPSLDTLAEPLPVSNLAHQDGILPKLTRRLVNDLGEGLAFPLFVREGKKRSSVILSRD